jgi:hypothetical protein
MRDLGDAGKHAAASDYAAGCATAAKDAVQSTTPWQVGRIPKQTAEESVSFMGDGDMTVHGNGGIPKGWLRRAAAWRLRYPERANVDEPGIWDMGWPIGSRNVPRHEEGPPQWFFPSATLQLHTHVSPATTLLHCHRPGYSKATCLTLPRATYDSGMLCRFPQQQPGPCLRRTRARSHHSRAGWRAEAAQAWWRALAERLC